MQKFTLELLFRIIGIGSASGLFYNDNSLYLISDNSHMLYHYTINDETLDKTPLVFKDYAGALENVPKKDKADYEAVAAKGDDLYLFGSGSGENRNLIGHINYKTKEVYPHIDATDLYLVMQQFGDITPENFNIEAAVNDGEVWYLFNRGNGSKAQNGIFTLTGTIDDTAFQIVYNKIKLPKIKGAQYGFTDAIKVEDKLYFIAAAESGESTYADGEVAGTMIGRINIDKMKVEFTEVISTKNKFEGITLYKEEGKNLEFLLCEDTDKDDTESDIYKVTIKK
ncbi:hypothetical protein Q765_15885 [Flavobacterium rivuli WB 3.3-2 = DSM 21788]|uniref:Apyrase n=1 Tax=Flavobacterium rivuli WB 3.3-2 = DSM 21788 TaxID=1121895 RepID=A0A0A2LYN9_9FLAO|nr:hypothetical protein [Flavobacterium rivuli]KGO85502.1 hypothetical protein Q765_15885 [Flavobacterium rivuli WB 3.3-2 = DSM 21788]